jgi:hypothetical protein
MLAKRRSIKIGATEIERTPLLIPSYSSKGFPQIQQIIEATEELIEGPLLVSAYDLHYKEVRAPLDYPSLVFLDSGGYEASKDAELSDYGEREHTPRPWTEQFYSAAINSWQASVPTVLITYDHPKERLTLAQQIARARRLTPARPNALRELLIKPETDDQKYVQIDSVIRQARALDEFDIIGLTEKELGSSFLQRMKAIAQLRAKLEKIGIETPIHIFGSLDTVSTVLYFIAGADIFDGLTWLRFAFKDGYTIYRQNFGALNLGVGTKAHMIDARCWFHNYSYMKELELQMRRFLKDGSFSVFTYHSEFLSNAFLSLAEELGE